MNRALGILLIASCVALLYGWIVYGAFSEAKIYIIYKPRFCSWVYWLLKAHLYSAVQVCDARNDTKRTAVWLKKSQLQNLGLRFYGFFIIT